MIRVLCSTRSSWSAAPYDTS